MVVTDHLFISAIGLGLAYNAAPGAVNTEALRRGLARGVRPAMLVELGALIGDSSWAVVALMGTAFLVRSKPLHIVLGIVGACFLLRLAWGALQEAWKGGVPGAKGQTSRGDFVTGVVFSVANPFALAFWSGIGGGLVETGGQMSSFAMLLGGFVLGAGAWCVFFPVLVGMGRRLGRPLTFRAINALCGVALGYFSLSLFWNTFDALVNHAAAAMAQLGRLAGSVLDRTIGNAVDI